MALGNTLEAFVIAYSLQKLTDFRTDINRVQDVLYLLGASFLGTMSSEPWFMNYDSWTWNHETLTTNRDSSEASVFELIILGQTFSWNISFLETIEVWEPIEHS